MLFVGAGTGVMGLLGQAWRLLRDCLDAACTQAGERSRPLSNLIQATTTRLALAATPADGRALGASGCMALQRTHAARHVA